MTIRIYPNRLEGEAIQTYETTGVLSVADWLQEADKEKFDRSKTHLFNVLINGVLVPDEDLELTFFGPDDDVHIHVEAKGIPEIIFAIVSIVMFAAMYAMRTNTPQDRKQGRTLSEPSALANTRRYGEPIPEIAGSPLIYPDYLLPPRRFYVATSHTSQKIVIVGRDPETGRPIFEQVTVEVFDGGQQWVEALMCVGMGEFQKSPSQVYVGDTNSLSLGDAFQLNFYEPGQDLSGQPIAKWWHTPEEVGFTSLGNSGITLTGKRVVAASWASDLQISGATITSPGTPLPAGWENGQMLRIQAPHQVTFGINSVQSALLDGMSTVVGDFVEIMGNRAGVYEVTSITPGSGGSPGSASSVTGDSPPARLDFSTLNAGFIINIGSQSFVVHVTTAFATVADLAEALSSQLNGTPVRVVETGGVLQVLQQPTYTGEAITLDSDVITFFGSDPAYVQGTPFVPANGTTYVLSGADFTPASEIAIVGKFGYLYQILFADTNSIIVTPEGVSGWVGFPSSVDAAQTTVTLTAEATDGGWAGWFAVCPENETCDSVEVDIFYPGGLIAYNDKGGENMQTAGGEIEIRPVGGGAVVRELWFSEGKTPDQFGRTIRVDLPPGRYEARVRASADPSDDSKRQDKQQWSGLRSRIVGAPTSYAGVTVMAVRMRSGDKIAGAVENKISMRGTRILPTIEDPEVSSPTRDIAPFFVHMMSTVGYGRNLLDMDRITELHEIWSGRNDRFDLSVDASSTLKTVANAALGAGFAELTLQRGKITAVRDALRPRIPSRMYSPADYTTPLVETTESVQPDEVDGVDVEYIDFSTGRTLTISYRLPEDQGVRVEKIKAVGVTNRTRAWRMAARRRRILAYRRTKWKGATEMQAFNSHYMDHVGLQDGIPSFGQSAFVIGVEGNALWLSEEIKPVEGPMIAFIRKQDGTAGIQSPVVALGHKLTFPNGITEPVVSMGEGIERPTMVFIGVVNDAIYPALMTSVNPGQNGKVSFDSVNYDERVYAEDDSGPDRIILTSNVYDSDRHTSLIYETKDKTSRVYPLEAIDSSESSAAVVRALKNPQPFAVDIVNNRAKVASITKTRETRYITYERFIEEVDSSASIVIIDKIRRVKYTRYDRFNDSADNSASIVQIIKTRSAGYITYDRFNDSADNSASIVSINKVRA